MTLTQADIESFLGACHPFALLPAEALTRLAASIEQRPMEEGGAVLELGQENQHLHVVHSGEVEIRSATGKIFGRIGSGQAFGIRALLGGGRATYRAVALKPGRLLLVPRAAFMELADIHPQFER